MIKILNLLFGWLDTADHVATLRWKREYNAREMDEVSKAINNPLNKEKIKSKEPIEVTVDGKLITIKRVGL